MRLIDADKIEYYPVDRNGKHIGEMVWKPHIDGIETFNLEEHDKQIRAEIIDEILPLIKDIKGLCRNDVLKDLIGKVEQLKE